MAVVDALATVALTVVLPPFLMVLVSVLVLASLGKSLGLRQRYVQFLLKVFEVSDVREGKDVCVPQPPWSVCAVCRTRTACPLPRVCVFWGSCAGWTGCVEVWRQAALKCVVAGCVGMRWEAVSGCGGRLCGGVVVCCVGVWWHAVWDVVQAVCGGVVVGCVGVWW